MLPSATHTPPTAHDPIQRPDWPQETLEKCKKTSIRVQSSVDSCTCPIHHHGPNSAIATHEHCAWSWTLIGTAIARLARQVSDTGDRG